MTYWMLPFTLQLVAQSVIVFLISLPFGKPVGFREGMLLVEWYPWWEKRWRFTTCVAFVYGSSSQYLNHAPTWFHETKVHVKQYEDLAVLGDVLAGVILLYGYVTGHHVWPLALGVWASAGPLWLLPNFLTALRFRKEGKELGWRTWYSMYMMSEHERSAYAQTSEYTRNGGGWG